MKSSIILLFLSLAAFSNCQKSEPVGNSQPVRTYDEIVAAAEREGIPLSQFGLKRNWNEVLAIAAIYGLQDTFRNQERTNNSLMFDTEDNLHAYFKQTKQVFDTRHQYKVYKEKGQQIQTLSDYFNLLDSLPLYRAKRYPSDEAYAALKKEYFASDYQFFINEAVQSGGKNHIPPFLIVVTKPEEMPTEKARRIKNQ
jgi:hypothetical protein